MNFIQKTIKTAGNAIEINSLKSDRKNVLKKIEEYTKETEKYALLLQLKSTIDMKKMSDENTIQLIRKFFITLDIPLDHFPDEDALQDVRPTSEIVSLYKLYITTQQSIRHCNDTLDELNKKLCVTTEDYQIKIQALQNELITINAKLDKVREKQFGKNK